jgi:SRSO17 transposase
VDDVIVGWVARFEDMFALVAGRFGRVEVRRRARGYLRGLLAPLERKNGWVLAEAAGDAVPDGMQRLLNFYRWDADAVRDDLRSYVVAHLGDSRAVLVPDETGFIKKGRTSAGVQRQYSGTAGRVENCQLGVFLAYAAPAGRALIDRELYLPRSWTEDTERCAAAGVPSRVPFATKPQLAKAMIGRALAAGTPFGWVAADEAYGQNTNLRRWLEQRGVSYVLAVPVTQMVTAPDGRRRHAEVLARHVPARAWERRSCGDGAKGPRLYDWALVALAPVPAGGQAWLLARRSISDPTHIAYYLAHATTEMPLAELVRVAGARWAVEECFQAAKNEVGLDHYQVRRYDAWYRHITLAMLAHAFLAATSTNEATKGVTQTAKTS